MLPGNIPVLCTSMTSMSPLPLLFRRAFGGLSTYFHSSFLATFQYIVPATNTNTPSSQCLCGIKHPKGHVLVSFLHNNICHTNAFPRSCSCCPSSNPNTLGALHRHRLCHRPNNNNYLQAKCNRHNNCMDASLHVHSLGSCFHYLFTSKRIIIRNRIITTHRLFL